MASSFEKVMEACLESKKATKAPAKKVTEQKKAPKRKAQLESVKKTPAKRKLREADEFDDAEEEVVDDEVMDDVADDIMVVIDPEIDASEIDTVADELQDIVDETPEGEVPTTDEYIGDDTYACPICGSTFFSETEMGEGDECPVCGGTPDGFVAVGEIAPIDDAVEGEDDVEIDDIDVDFGEEDGGDLEVADAEEDEVEFESRVRRPARRPRVESTKKPVARRPARRPAQSKARFESNKKPVARKPMRKTATRKPTGYQLDESTFNPFMTKFIRENYKNARSFTIKSATHFKGTNTLKIECVVTMKNGSKKRATLKVERFNPNSKVMLAKDASRTFKCEGKVAPFRFAVRKVGNTIKCEGLRYNYTTKKVNESAKYRVSGSYVRESAQRKPMPKRPAPQKRTGSKSRCK